MEYTNLGTTGLQVSKLCFGTWRFGESRGGSVETTEREAHRLLDACADLGINFIDTANRYGSPPGTSEEYLGSWLADRDRDDFVISTKVGLPMGDGVNDRGLSRRHVRQQIDASLERLGTDYIDVYYIHRLDGTPIEETLSVLDEAVKSAKIHYIGASTMAAWELANLCLTMEGNGWEKFVVTQPPVDATLNNWKRYPRFNLHRYLEFCEDYGLGVCPYSPLAGGFLTGKYRRDGDDPSDIESPENSRGQLLPDTFKNKYLSESAWRVLDEIESIADEIESTPTQVALRWAMELYVNGPMVPVIGARTPAQLEENVGATDVRLDRDHLDRIADARGDSLAFRPRTAA